MTKFKKDRDKEVKECIKGVVDEITVDTDSDFEILKLIYCFAKSGLKEIRAGKQA